MRRATNFCQSNKIYKTGLLFPLNNYHTMVRSDTPFQELVEVIDCSNLKGYI